MVRKPDGREEAIHVGFEIGLFLKGMDGLLEIIGGVFLTFLNPERLSRLANFLTQRELSEDPNDRVANTLLTLAHSFSISTQQFGVLYLLSHGGIKLLLVLLLWRKKRWAYPLTILSLILFIAYQVYRYTFTQSPVLILLTLLDAAMIVLTYLEYQRIRSASELS